ncbi:DNA (cytosine-5-)-methyltransferase [Mycoplasmopsis agassizii]|uniref:Cytosine-specific methyltransferase n=1 Tax=Mycoplasmopsis agassizii TaxID=33922 RepID=A0A269TI79_9BACT|nr:DNA cytosine methyltransferase [Mycoplasmopsis agassizii]PAK20890.1 DNA (cytosine-5-)-methyltransferase [Mycoplasmopsis agassizii]
MGLKKTNFKFIDLFAGIGGFHAAMSNLGGECVFASEIDKYAIESYLENYGINADNDVTKVDPKKIAPYNVLCAGFPCQPFSKAGAQLGFSDKIKGTLFFEIVRLLQENRPEYLILENVRNLVAHDNGNTYRVIMKTLDEIGYTVNDKPIIMSPHQLGIPQLRERVYILGVRKDLGVEHINIELAKGKKQDLSIYSANIIEEEVVDQKYYISDYEEKVLTAWDEFYQGIQEKIIGFPVFSAEFKETYDLDSLPKWKQDFYRKSRQLYQNNKKFIDKWLKKYNNLQDFTPTDRKFEWQAGTAINSLWEGIIQFRPSGIRVKRPDSFPALVAMVQIPIIGKLRRRLTPRETARLQSFPDSFKPNINDKQAYKQFGNAVNVICVEYLARQLFSLVKEKELMDNSSVEQQYLISE